MGAGWLSSTQTDIRACRAAAKNVTFYFIFLSLLKTNILNFSECIPFGRPHSLYHKEMIGNLYTPFKVAQTGRLMVFSGENWYHTMHFLYAEALVKTACLKIPISIV